MIADARLGNTPRYHRAPPRDFGRRVPDEVLKSVVYIGRKSRRRSQEQIVWGGTAFLASVPASYPNASFCYLVTAKHVADEVVGDRFYVRINAKDGGSIIVEGAETMIWRRHPSQEDSAAVAVCPRSPPDVADFRFIPASMFLTDEAAQQNNSGPGDEVFITGLFSKMEGRSRNFPIVRTGNVAMMPTETLPDAKIGNWRADLEAYLIEARSIGGLSGSPAVVQQTTAIGMSGAGRGKPEVERMEIAGPGRFFVFGLMHGHWNIRSGRENDVEILSRSQRDDAAVNLGVAVVVPAKKILAGLNHPELIQQRRRDEEEEKRSRGTTEPDDKGK